MQYKDIKHKCFLIRNMHEAGNPPASKTVYWMLETIEDLLRIIKEAKTSQDQLHDEVEKIKSHYNEKRGEFLRTVEEIYPEMK